MRKLLTSFLFMILPSLVVAAPPLSASPPEVVSVPRSDCANWVEEVIPQFPFGSSATVIRQTYSARQGKGVQLEPWCNHSGASYTAVSAEVYTRAAMDRRLDDLTRTLQSALDDSVVEAAIQEDQIALVSDEVWKRLHVKLAADLEALQKESQALKAEIETMRKTLQEMRAAAKAGR